MLRFDHLLTEAGLDLHSVRLLRHQDTRRGRNGTPYTLWRDAPSEFERYQCTQRKDFRGHFSGTHWASFVGTPDGGTLFVGLYEVALGGDVPDDWIDPLLGLPPGGDHVSTTAYDFYSCVQSPLLSDLVGRVWIDWGKGERSWRQRADARNKPIIEISRRFREPGYPGHSRFFASLSELDKLPATWLAILGEERGVYLLTCPRTKEQYVGKADGSAGFLGRWREYAVTGHGGNIALKSRDPSDYRVSILEVAGSSASHAEIQQMEILWKEKLQSREMGLNRN